MKKRFHELYESLKQDRERSEWSRQHSLESRYREMLKEVEELGDAIKRQGRDEIKDEFGDVLWDLMSCAIIAEDMGMLSLNDVIEHANKKLKRRKPWVFDGRKLSLVDEKREYQEIKGMEKETEKPE
ncbi:MAG: MazG nucleotide pyrophosphohydrolase domain-containing protein [Candidatus Woesearchaeota archaeon]